MSTLVYILLATSFISLFSLLGVLTLSLKQDFLEKILFHLVGLSTGTLLGGAFFHLLIEAGENYPIQNVYLITIFSFVIFFLIEKVLHWRHCHEGECDVHSFGYINLIGDAVHNFIDGMIIAGTFSVSVPLGIASTVALSFHEIPQEISDFGVLLYSGISKSKAIYYNFLVAVTSVLGGIVGFFLVHRIDNLLNYLLPFAAGGFIYISTSDLIPELREHSNLKNSIISTLLFLLGIALMFFLKD